jgi:hypothetical protein
MEDIIIDEVDLEKNIVNNNKEWDKCCFYTGVLSLLIVITSFIVILVFVN